MRTGRTYFSEFTAPSATLSVGKIQRAKSNEHLSRFCKSKQSKSSLLSPSYFQLQLPKAKSTQDLRKDDRKSAKFAASQVYLAAEEPDASIRLAFEQELEEELQKLLKRSTYNTVTVPSSVKFSVTGDVPNKQPQLAFTSPGHSSSAMSRPRSPKSKEPQQLEGLEKLLYNIRQQLVSTCNIIHARKVSSLLLVLLFRQAAKCACSLCGDIVEIRYNLLQRAILYKSCCSSAATAQSQRCLLCLGLAAVVHNAVVRQHPLLLVIKGER